MLLSTGSFALSDAAINRLITLMLLPTNSLALSDAAINRLVSLMLLNRLIRFVQCCYLPTRWLDAAQSTH